MELQNSLLSQHAKLVSKLFLVVLVLTLGVAAVQAQWTDPSDPPPQSNTPTPVNVGSEAQTKSGGLGVENIGGVSAEMESYVKVGNIEGMTCDESKDGVLGVDSSCLMFCIDAGDDTYEWVELGCIE